MSDALTEAIDMLEVESGIPDHVVRLIPRNFSQHCATLLAVSEAAKVLAEYWRGAAGINLVDDLQRIEDLIEAVADAVGMPAR